MGFDPAIFGAMTDDQRATPTALLREEHELIVQVAGALGVRLAGHNELDYDNLDRCVTFFRLYADACHHGKEEDMLFPALVANGLPQEAGPIAVMLMEHDEGRKLVGAMADSAMAARRGDAGAADALVAASIGFVDLITTHIAKENSILFEMADHVIEGSDRRDLLAAYEGTADHRYEGHSKADLEQIADEILQGWSSSVG